MEDVVKNFVYTGVSIFAFAVDSVRETVENLMNEEKISAEEGKKIIDDFVENTEAKKDEFESQLKVVSEKLMESFKSHTSTSIEDLEARIESLESKAPAKKTTAKKTADTAATA